MNQIILTQRDISFCCYLHKNKVATSKQIHRDIFRKNYTNLRNRLSIFEDKGYIQRVYGKNFPDRSRTYSLTPKGLKIVKSNLKDVINQERFKSDSVNHDLHLVDIRNFFKNKQMIKEYYTENQIQTYVDFQNLPKLVPFKELRVDALIGVQETGKQKLYIPLEYEAQSKSVTWYQTRMGKIYHSKLIPFVFYICATTQVEDKLKKAESHFVKDGPKRIFYITLEKLLKTTQSVTFLTQDGRPFHIN